MGFLAIVGIPPAKKKKPTKYKNTPKSVDSGGTGFGVSDGSTGSESFEYRIFCTNKPELEKYLYVKEIQGEYATRLPTHPLENGMIKHDHKIVEPRRYTANAYVKAIGTAEDITQAGVSIECSKILDELVQSSDLGDVIYVESPMENVPTLKLYLLSYNKRTEADKTDVFSFTLHLQEILMAENETQITQNPDFAGNSVKGGQGQGTKG